jgi:hypothetical protein
VVNGSPDLLFELKSLPERLANHVGPVDAVETRHSATDVSLDTNAQHVHALVGNSCITSTDKPFTTTERRPTLLPHGSAPRIVLHSDANLNVD